MAVPAYAIDSQHGAKGSFIPLPNGVNAGSDRINIKGSLTQPGTDFSTAQEFISEARSDI